MCVYICLPVLFINAFHVIILFVNCVDTSHKLYYVFTKQIKNLMLFREVVCVDWNKHTGLYNTLYGQNWYLKRMVCIFATVIWNIKCHLLTHFLCVNSGLLFPSWLQCLLFNIILPSISRQKCKVKLRFSKEFYWMFQNPRPQQETCGHPLLNSLFILTLLVDIITVCWLK